MLTADLIEPRLRSIENEIRESAAVLESLAAGIHLWSRQAVISLDPFVVEPDRIVDLSARIIKLVNERKMILADIHDIGIK
jgi:hypothetical protein